MLTGLKKDQVLKSRMGKLSISYIVGTNLLASEWHTYMLMVNT